MKMLYIIICVLTINLSAQWKVSNLSDEFGNDTGDKYLEFNTHDGTFGITDTQKSKLHAKVSVMRLDDIDNFGLIVTFELYEYGSNPVTSTTLKSYDCRVKYNGSVYNFDFGLIDNIFFIGAKIDNLVLGIESFVHLLFEGEIVKVYLEKKYYSEMKKFLKEKDYQPTYDFEIDGKGYKKLHQQVFGDIEIKE